MEARVKLLCFFSLLKKKRDKRAKSYADYKGEDLADLLKSTLSRLFWGKLNTQSYALLATLPGWKVARVAVPNGGRGTERKGPCIIKTSAPITDIYTVE